MDSITVHDLEFEWENYSNFKNINAALNSYALVKWHPVNTHGGSAKNIARAQFSREAQPCHDPSDSFLSLILCPLREQDFCHWTSENKLSQILFFRVSFHRFPGI